MKSSNENSGIYLADTSRTLDVSGGNPDCNQGGIVVIGTYDVRISSEGTKNQRAHCYPTEISRCHDGAGQIPDSNHGGVIVVENHPNENGGNVPIVLCSSKADYHTKATEEQSGALVASDYKDPPIVYGLDRASFNQGRNVQFDFSIEEERIAPLVAKGLNAVAAFYPQMKAESICYREDDVSNCLVNGTNPGFQNGIVASVARRLTPLECERLQGFPDGWTDIGDWVDSKGKKHKGESDAPRYKALGDSIALPFWGWLLSRMVDYLPAGATMASLFDGIGGFPLLWERIHGKGTAVWASEIEEFPIAVTKMHFAE